MARGRPYWELPRNELHLSLTGTRAALPQELPTLPCTCLKYPNYTCTCGWCGNYYTVWVCPAGASVFTRLQQVNNLSLDQHRVALERALGHRSYSGTLKCFVFGPDAGHVTTGRAFTVTPQFNYKIEEI